MGERDEGVPVVVEFDAAKLQQWLRTLLDPAHAAFIEPLRDEIANRAFDHAAAEFEVFASELGPSRYQPKSPRA